MKPILFNTDMVCAILNGRKTCTRRVVKPQPEGQPIFMPSYSAWPGYFAINGTPKVIKPPYQPGDILYVRETWNYGYVDTTDFECQCNEPFFEELPHGSRKDTYLMPRYFYRTEDLDGLAGMKWHPSIHMPKEAARIFLRVTDVRAERLQDISPMGVSMEGVKILQSNEWDCEMSPDAMRRFEFAGMWDNTIKKADLPLYGWNANPWVWVIDFERIDRNETNLQA